MFHLAIVFILLTGNQVGFLSNHFTDGWLTCQNNGITYLAQSDREKTYHQFTLPEGGGWNCNICIQGRGILFPSSNDMVVRNIK